MHCYSKLIYIIISNYSNPTFFSVLMLPVASKYTVIATKCNNEIQGISIETIAYDEGLLVRTFNSRKVFITKSACVFKY